MSLTTAYVLPYDVMWSDGPLMSLDDDVRVRVALRSEADDQAAGALDALMTPFVLLASSGAMAGEAIPPGQSGIADKEGPFASGQVVDWVLRKCLVDERSIAMLAQMMLTAHGEFPIARIALDGTKRISATQTLLSASTDSRTYPEVYRNPGFVVSCDPELGRDIEVRVAFAQANAPSFSRAIDAELFSWAAGLLSGGYGIAPFVPDRCVASIGTTAVYLPSEMSFSMNRFEAHPAALNGLINVFTRISENIIPVAELSID